MIMAKIAKRLLKWRRRLRTGAIMTSEKFAQIKRKAAAAGARVPSAVAGAAYWTTTKAKFRARMRRRRRRVA